MVKSTKEAPIPPIPSLRPGKSHSPSRSPAKQRVLTPHQFLAHVFGIAAANSNFAVRRRRLVNAGKEAYRAYLQTMDEIATDEEMLKLMANYEMLEE